MPSPTISFAQHSKDRLEYVIRFRYGTSYGSAAEAIASVITTVSDLDEKTRQLTTVTIIEDTCAGHSGSLSLTSILGFLRYRNFTFPAGIIVIFVHFRLHSHVLNCTDVLRNVRRVIAVDCELAAHWQSREDHFAEQLAPGVEFHANGCCEYTGWYPEDPQHSDFE